MDLYVATDGDFIGRKVGQARLEDDVDQIRKIDQLINKGNDLIKSFALNSGGSWIEGGGDESVFSIPAGYIDQLPKIRQQYAELVGATLSVGVGLKISEASKALLISKIRGRDKLTFWEPTMEKEIKEAQDNAPNEKQKIVEEYLSKGQYRSEPSKQRAVATQGDHSAASVTRDAIENAETPPPPELTHAEDDFEKHAHMLAQNQDTQDEAAKNKKASNHDDLKNQVAQILQVIKTQAPVMAQIKATAPDTYASIMRLVQGVIAMARELEGSTAKVPGNQPTEESVSKSEEDMWELEVFGQ